MSSSRIILENHYQTEPSNGLKNDFGLVEYGLIPPIAHRLVVKYITTFINRIGETSNWKRLFSSRRSIDGLMQHINDYQRNLTLDSLVMATIYAMIIMDPEPVAIVDDCNEEGDREEEEDTLRFSLIPQKALREVALVMTFGAKKYGRGNWKYVEDGKRRYLEALLRHVHAYRAGNVYDEESTFAHLAHAVCCMLFLIENPFQTLESQKE